ncbi:hypothetical protein HN51_000201 [Arachis hypogaea]
MTLNLVLLIAIVATNILSLYHLSSTLQSPKSPPLPPPLLLPNRAAQTFIPSPSSPFPSSLPDFSVIWDHYPCKSFDCFHRQNPNLGFNPSFDSSKFTIYWCSTE